MRKVDFTHDSIYIYDKRDEFDFPIVCSKSINILESSPYGVFCFTVDTLCSGLF